MSAYKIKDLAILSGVKAHTIRIWEKRYNLLTPQRTSTKIRTYDERQLRRLLNIAVLYNSGWRISKIAALSENELVDEVRESTQSHQHQSVVVTLFVEALLELDHVKFEDLLDRRIEKEGFEQVYRHYVIPFLERIGILWISDSIHPAQEHFISVIIRQKLIAAIDRLANSQRSSVEFVLFTPSNERHEISLLFYHYYLKKRGHNVLYLGTDVPDDSLQKVLTTMQPDCLITSLVVSRDIPETRTYLSQLAAKYNLRVYCGGAFVEQLNLDDLDEVFHINAYVGV